MKKTSVMMWTAAGAVIISCIFKAFLPDILPFAAFAAVIFGACVTCLPDGEKTGNLRFLIEREVPFTLGGCLTAMFLACAVAVIEGKVGISPFMSVGPFDLSPVIGSGFAAFVLSVILSSVITHIFLFGGLLGSLKPKGFFAATFIPAAFLGMLHGSFWGFFLGLACAFATLLLGTCWPAIFMGVFSGVWLYTADNISRGFDLMNFWPWFLIANLFLLFASLSFFLKKIGSLKNRGKLSPIKFVSLKPNLVSIGSAYEMWIALAVFIVFSFLF